MRAQKLKICPKKIGTSDKITLKLEFLPENLTFQKLLFCNYTSSITLLVDVPFQYPLKTLVKLLISL